jgi:hypothetical protein
MEIKFPCPSCGYLVFIEPPGSFEICPICFWEDDNIQLQDPSMAGGANGVSLITAQNNYANIGAIEENFITNVRKPHADENKDNGWRPFDLNNDNHGMNKDNKNESIKLKSDVTKLYYWR